MRTTAQLCTLSANQCPSFERYVATFYHLSPSEVRSAASGRWEVQTKASSVQFSVKICLLFRWDGKKDRSSGPPSSKIETPCWIAQHDAVTGCTKLKRKHPILKQLAELKQDHFAVHGSSLQSEVVSGQDRDSVWKSRPLHKNGQKCSAWLHKLLLMSLKQRWVFVSRTFLDFHKSHQEH